MMQILRILRMVGSKEFLATATSSWKTFEHPSDLVSRIVDVSAGQIKGGRP